LSCLGTQRFVIGLFKGLPPPSCAVGGERVTFVRVFPNQFLTLV